MYSQSARKKALEMLALTGDFEKSARMSGISGRTLRRWAANAAGPQQTIVAVEAMVSGECAHAKEEPRRSLYLDFDTETKRAARIKKRQELFESAKAHPLVLPPDAPSPVDVIREAREERSKHIGEVLDEIMERRVSYGGN